MDFGKHAALAKRDARLFELSESMRRKFTWRYLASYFFGLVSLSTSWFASLMGNENNPQLQVSVVGYVVLAGVCLAWARRKDLEYLKYRPFLEAK